MVKANPHDNQHRLTGSQAARLLAQGKLGSALIQQASELANDPDQVSIPFPVDQAHALRCAVAAHLDDDLGGDAA